MMNLNSIRSALQTKKLRVVAELTGLSYMTIYMIASGKNTSPNINTIKKLEKFLKLDAARAKNIEE